MSHNNMKPFLLMAGSEFYPNAGDGDWIDTFETAEDAMAEVKIRGTGQSVSEIEFYPSRRSLSQQTFIIGRRRNYEWYQIVDLREWMGTREQE